MKTNSMFRKIAGIIALLSLWTAPSFSQSKFELGLFGDYMYLGQYTKSGKASSGNAYEIAQPPLSVGAYANLYITPAFGLHFGIQYISASNGTYHYKLSVPPFTEQQYVYDYSAIKIPVGITGDLTGWIYYHAGVNFHIDQSKVRSYNDNVRRVNGMGLHGELGLHRSLAKGLVKVRLGLNAQNENLVSFEDAVDDIYNVGVRLRVGLRL